MLKIWGRLASINVRKVALAAQWLGLEFERTDAGHLRQREFTAGDTFTMADIPLACGIDRWQALPRKRPSRPHLQRWFDALLTQPAAGGVLNLPSS